MFRHMMIGIAAVVAAGMTFAQEPAPKAFFFQRFAGSAEAPPPGAGNVTFVSTEMSFEGKTVTGVPYTAEAVTETTQTLADGNRISQTTRGLVARDSAGRMRREQTIGPGLMTAAQGEPMKLVFINDPVAQTAYVLQPDHTAQKMPLAKGPLALAAGGYTISSGPPVAGGPAIAAMMVKSELGSAPKQFTINSKATEEDLGQETIEGIPAEHKRTTSVIPAGTIGNEQDIKIVGETWYSNELQTLVSSTHADPRMGTTTYRLTNIQRTEPSPDLFQVPADYVVREPLKPGTTSTQWEYKTTK